MQSRSIETVRKVKRVTTFRQVAELNLYLFFDFVTFNFFNRLKSMVAKLEGPQFSGGANIAIKCPSHTYDQTVAFYRDTLGLPLIEEEKEGCIFQFGPNRLWIDKVPNLSQPDIWLELETNDTEAAASFLKVHGVTRRDEVEQLSEDFNGFFISAPNGVIHLVIGPEA